MSMTLVRNPFKGLSQFLSKKYFITCFFQRIIRTSYNINICMYTYECMYVISIDVCYLGCKKNSLAVYVIRDRLMRVPGKGR